MRDRETGAGAMRMLVVVGVMWGLVHATAPAARADGAPGCLYVNAEAGFVLPYAPDPGSGRCREERAADRVPAHKVFPGSFAECLAHMNDLFGDPGVRERRLVGVGKLGFVYGVNLAGEMGGKVFPEHVFMTYDFSPGKRAARPCVVLGFHTGRPLSDREREALAGFRWIPLEMARLPARARAAGGVYLGRVRMFFPFGYDDRFHVGGSFWVWSPRRCPGCIVQIVVGYGEEPLGCLYDGKPGPFPGVKGSQRLTFPLPPGAEAYEPLDLRYKRTLAYTCGQAMEMYRAAPPPREQGIPFSRR